MIKFTSIIEKKYVFPRRASGDTRATRGYVLLLYERVAEPWATPVSRCCICGKLEMYRFLTKFEFFRVTLRIFFGVKIFFDEISFGYSFLSRLCHHI